MSPVPESRDRVGRLEAAGVFALALALRWLHVRQIAAAPFANLRIGDAEGYHEWAARIAGGEWLGAEVFYQAPLYPYFLGTLYTIVGQEIGTLRAIQAVLGALSCVLLYLAGTRWFGRREGLAAGVLMAVYAPAIYFDTLLQKSVLDLWFLCLLLWIAGVLADEPRRGGGWIALGAALGGLALSRENALVFVPGILIWAVVGFRGLGARRYASAALFVAGMGLVLLPVAVRNLAVGGEFHLTTSQLGPNLYIGNHAGASGLYEPLRERRGHVRFERQDAIEIAEEATGKTLTPGEVSSYYLGRVAGFARERPGEWLGLLGRKWVLAWNAVEIADTEDQYTYAARSWVLRGTGYLAHLGLLAPLALFGAWVTWADRRRVWLLYLLLAVYVVSVVAFFVFARYRLPMVPFLILFAGAGVAGAVSFVRESSTRRLVACGASVVALAVFCNWPVIDRERMTSTTRFNLGAALAMQGRLDEALRQYRAAVEIRPNHLNAQYSLGTTLLQAGRAEEAVAPLEQVLRLRPDHADAWLQLGRVQAELGDLDLAVAHYENSLRHAPDRAPTHYILANALQRRGDAAGAAEHYREAIRLDPGHAQAYNNLGNLHLAARDLDRARTLYEQAIRLDAGNAQAHYNLGVVFELGGNRERAMALMQQAVRLKPDFEMARERLQALRRGGGG